ncbi:hypothetical protein ACFQW6_13760 [Nocardioides sp. GCM10028917]|uniref:hypothetical protein n=1 Tax=Nocardioides sp. GCM10028917 TaxID=3273408 RepID=UPI003609D3F5
MRTTTLGAAVAALALPLTTMTPAHAANEVVVTMAGGVIYDSCGDYDFSYSASLPAGYGPYWNMDLELVGPDGNVTSSNYLFGEVTTGTDSFFLCDSPNLAGTYTIRGTGTTRDSNYNAATISVAPTSVTFRLPMTRTLLKAKPSRPTKNQVVRFTITAQDERPAGYFETSYASVKLQSKRNGDWRTIKSTTTSESGKAVVKARYGGGRAQVRAVTLNHSDRTGSTSRVVKFK